MCPTEFSSNIFLFTWLSIFARSSLSRRVRRKPHFLLSLPRWLGHVMPILVHFRKKWPRILSYMKGRNYWCSFVLSCCIILLFQDQQVKHQLSINHLNGLPKEYDLCKKTLKRSRRAWMLLRERSQIIMACVNALRKLRRPELLFLLISRVGLKINTNSVWQHNILWEKRFWNCWTKGGNPTIQIRLPSCNKTIYPGTERTGFSLSKVRKLQG